MKLVRVVWELMYASNDEEQKAKRADDEANILAFLAAANAREEKSHMSVVGSLHARCHLMDSDTALEFIATFGNHDYYKSGVKSVEVLCDSAGMFESRMNRLMERMERMASSMDLRNSSSVDGSYAAAWNDYVGAPVPGFNLGLINDLNLMQDCCTDELQGMLDSGWRLIAVCPQESRRPDYILGRHVAMPRNAGRALRGDR